MLLASELIIVCGKSSITWDRFSSLLQSTSRTDPSGKVLFPANVLYTDLAKRSFETTKMSHGLKSVYDEIKNEGLFGIEGLAELGLTDIIGPPKQETPPMALWLLFASLISRLATNPWDKVYGLYGVLIELNIHIAEPNYDMPLLKVYEEFLMVLMTEMRSMAILTDFELEFNSGDSPSWVPNFSGSLRRTQRSQVESSLSIYGNHLDWTTKMSTSRFRPGFELNYEPGRLIVEGVIIGSIKIIGNEFPYLNTDNISNFQIYCWLDTIIQKCKDSPSLPPGYSSLQALFELLSGTSVSEEFTKTIVDGFHSIKNKWKAATNVGFPESADMDRLQTAFDLFLEIPGTQNILQTMSYFTNCQGMFPVLVDNGIIGMVEAPVSGSGDVLVLFYGATKPIILRPEGEFYRMICRAHIAGIKQDPSLLMMEDRDDIQLITLI
jgi:hypothetical protein